MGRRRFSVLRRLFYQLRSQSSQLPPSFRFPPLREGNRVGRMGSPRFARGTAWGAWVPPLREGNRVGRMGSPASRGEPRGAHGFPRFARGTRRGSVPPASRGNLKEGVVNCRVL